MKVLDTNYKIKYLKKQNQTMVLSECEGYCDFEKKEIYVLNNYEKLDTLVHELIHAHLYEMGMCEKALDEELVEIIAKLVIRVSKLLK